MSRAEEAWGPAAHGDDQDLNVGRVHSIDDPIALPGRTQAAVSLEFTQEFGGHHIHFRWRAAGSPAG